MNEESLSPPTVKRLTPDLPFRFGETGPTPAPTVGDFWAWAFSDLKENTTRGVLAEFVVGLALECASRSRRAWDNWDLTTRDGVRIEVRASAYLQAWKQRRLSKIRFRPLAARSWSEETGKYEEARALRADVYVFGLQCCSTHDAYDALDLAQWSFEAVPRNALEEHQDRALSLETVRRLSTGTAGFATLREAVRKAADRQGVGDPSASDRDSLRLTDRL